MMELRANRNHEVTDAQAGALRTTRSATRPHLGCNLLRHPGIDVFRDVLVGLLDRPDVEAVYAQISEIDP